MIITCYKGGYLPFGVVDNTYETDESFTGVVIDNGIEKKKLHYPWRIMIYDDDVVLKDEILGKSYRINPSLVVNYNTKDKLLTYLRDCIENEYYQEFYPIGDEITVGYDLSGYTSWTKDSINDSIIIYQQGVRAYYDTLPFTAGNNIQFQILAGNKIKFARPQQGRRVQVQIRNRFKT